MTSFNDITRLLRGGSGSRGAAMFLLREMKRPGCRSNPALRRMCEEIASRTTEPLPPMPRHPQELKVKQQYKRNDEELTQVELAWLQRLSTADPTDVTFADAGRLAALAESISSMKAPASARYVNEIWQPIKAIHDKRVAEARLQQARQPLPSIPSTALDAITELLASEHPEIGDDALHLQANELLARFQTTRQQGQERAIRSAESDIAALDRFTSDRQSLDGQAIA